MYSAFINSDDISPELSLLTSLLTKVSFICTAIICILFDKRVQKTLRHMLSWKKSETSNKKINMNDLTIETGTRTVTNQEKKENQNFDSDAF